MEVSPSREKTSETRQAGRADFENFASAFFSRSV